ncbi:MAG: type II secretion system F family protein [Candidatus Pacearchaeota archaeon]
MVLKNNKEDFHFRIPFTIGNLDIQKRKVKKIAPLFHEVKAKKLKEFLASSDVNISVEEYLGIVTRTFILSLIWSITLFTLICLILKINFLIGIASGFSLCVFIAINQINYPRIYSFKKSQNIEKNLIPALQDMQVQLESGIPTFHILSNISNSNYGQVSKEFKKVVRELNTGVPQIVAIEGLIKKNSSEYFKRVLWQISNGLRSGSDMSSVIKDIIDNLNKEQAIQIQSYGNKLNPIVMFYMLITVIMPSLGITFLIIMSSMLGIRAGMVKLIFIALFSIIVIIQIMFLGLIKTKRPSLL